MVKKGIVERNLERLRKLKKEDLTNKIVKQLTGMSSSSLYNRINDRGIDYRNKEDVAALIEENRPLLEEWPDSNDLGRVLHAGKHVYTYWYRSEPIRRRIGIEKVLNKLWFNLDWFNNVKEEAERLGGDLLTQRVASEISGVPYRRLRMAKKAIPSIQPAGPKTLRFYSRKGMEELKRQLDKANDPTLLTSEQVANEIGALIDDVRESIPHKCVHPISGRFLYEPSVLDKYKDAVFVRCTSLGEIVKYYEKNIFNGKNIKRKLQYLIWYDKIPSERMSGRKRIYIPREGETMIKNIYTHLRDFKKEKIELISLHDAAKRIGLTALHLGRLIRECGKEYFLTSKEMVVYNLDTKHVQRKVALRPIVPYVRWVERACIYLTSPIVEALSKGIKRIKEDAESRNIKPFDGYWLGRLAVVIRDGLYRS